MAKQKVPTPSRYSYLFPSHLVSVLADEVAKTVIERIPHMVSYPRKKGRSSRTKTVEGALFFDTSAIIDGRIFEVINLGLLNNTFVIPEEILLELKHIADSQDMVKRERGRKGLELLEKLKKKSGVKVVVLSNTALNQKRIEVDERLIQIAKQNKGRIITCDYNLEKKATIQGVTTINMNALAQTLKVTAVPGEALHIRILHTGKDVTQGVGYLDDGTMIVVEYASSDLGKTIDVVIARVISTASGRILFAKKI